MISSCFSKRSMKTPPASSGASMICCREKDVPAVDQAVRGEGVAAEELAGQVEGGRESPT